jgi:hypothetical protein
MANMSYCRFKNTYQDLEDCAESLREKDLSELSESEQKHAIWLIQLCKQIAEEYEYLITD